MVPTLRYLSVKVIKFDAVESVLGKELQSPLETIFYFVSLFRFPLSAIADVVILAFLLDIFRHFGYIEPDSVKTHLMDVSFRFYEREV